MSTKSRKRRRSYSDVWPKRRPEALANSIVVREMNNWLSVENSLISEKLLPFHQYHESNINIMLSSSTLTLIYNGLCRKISCSEVHDRIYQRALFCIRLVSMLTR